jgi:hypothetical protein
LDGGSFDWGRSIHSPIEAGGGFSLGCSQEGSHEPPPSALFFLASAFCLAAALYDGERLLWDLLGWPKSVHPDRSRHPAAPHTSRRATLAQATPGLAGNLATDPDSPSSGTPLKGFGPMDLVLLTRNDRPA